MSGTGTVLGLLLITPQKLYVSSVYLSVGQLKLPSTFSSSPSARSPASEGCPERHPSSVAANRMVDFRCESRRQTEEAPTYTTYYFIVTCTPVAFTVYKAAH